MADSGAAAGEKCGSCGKEMLAGARFCAACGAARALGSGESGPRPDVNAETLGHPLVQALFQGPISLLSAGFLLLVMLAAIFAPLVAPHDPEDQQLRIRHLAPLSSGIATNRQGNPPVAEERFFLLGTDHLGRDVLSRLIYSARLTLAVGVLGVLIAGVIGVALGLLAGYCRGVVDYLIKLTMDVCTVVPDLMLALLIIYILGPSVTNLIIAFTITRSPFYFRAARGVVLSSRSQPAGRAAGDVGGPHRQSMAAALVLPLMAVAAIEVPRNIIMESTLSFIGFGIQPPYSSWGLMLAQGRQYIVTAPWVVVAPGVAAFFTVLALYLLGRRTRSVGAPLGHGRG